MDNQARLGSTAEGQNVSADTAQPQIRWIDRSELVFRRQLGKGGYGVVDEYEWKGYSEPVAVETLSYDRREILEHEAALLSKVQGHTNVVELYGCAFNEKQNKGMLVMELLKNDLRSLIDECRRSQPPGATPFFQRVAVDLQYLRQLRVLHRDLKAQNILVNPRRSGNELYYDVKLLDFSRSKCNEQDSRFYSVVAPPNWRAPEAFSDKNMVSGAYKWPSDVYSFGMVCYEILGGNFPFQDMCFEELLEAIVMVIDRSCQLITLRSFLT